MTWIQTFQGRPVDLVSPDPRTITLEDVAKGLRQPRFSGHTNKFYSVAEHSIWAARIARREGYSIPEQLVFLFHDAHESYVGDLASPVKRVMEQECEGFGDAWSAMVNRLDRAIWDALSPYEWKLYNHADVCQHVKTVDLQLLMWERCHLLGACERAWNVNGEDGWQSWGFVPSCWDADTAAQLFVEEAISLGARNYQQ